VGGASKDQAFVAVRGDPFAFMQGRAADLAGARRLVDRQFGATLRADFAQLSRHQRRL